MRDYDNEKTLKENIVIQEHKSWNTKKVMNGKWNMRIYRKVPKELKFRSKMINDMNQNFCGGWGLNGFDLSDEALLNRVLNGLKPMCVCYFSKDKENEVDNLLTKVDREKFYLYMNKQGGYNKQYIEIIVAAKGKLKELFDLDKFKEDYWDNNIYINTSHIKDRELNFYFKDWDHQNCFSNIELWETGLILGYPVENTISIYRQ